MIADRPTLTVQKLQEEGVLLVEDGNHGEYRPRPDEFSSVGVSFIRAADIDAGRVLFSSASRINEIALARIRKGIGKPGDILLSHKGTVGKLALAQLGCEPFVCSPQTTFWRVLDLSRMNRRFLYFYMQSQAFQEQLNSVKGETDMADYASLTAQRRFKIPLVDISVQKEIAAVLGALDDKIELNRKMNETLEAMARAIFKDWFVDFGPTRAKMEGRQPYLAPDLWALFPDQLDEEEKPEGWQIEPLDKIADFLNGLALQKYPANGDTYLPVIKIAELRAASAANSDRASVNIPSQYIIEDGDVLFSWSGSLLHRVWTAGKGALNQHLFKVTSERVPKWFYFHWIGHHMESFQATAASKATTMGHIQRHHLAQAMTIVPSNLILKEADKIISPLFDRRIANDLTSRTLAQTRDLLLPKLMSGEIRLKEAEKMVEDAL